MTDSIVYAAGDSLATIAQTSQELTPSFFVTLMKNFSTWAIPALIFLALILGWYKKVKVYEAFIDGAKEGFTVAIKIIPYLVAILVAIGMFRASGAMDGFVALLSPLTNLIGMPAETLPVALMRPLSGSGALGLVTELMKIHGPDSFIGRVSSTMWGSTETTFYVIAVYFGAVGVRRVRHSIAAGLVGDAVGLIAAVLICRIVFG
ncbi:MAG: spore maturation protein [Candidatus Neomarinimicrobiota bacterium]